MAITTIIVAVIGAAATITAALIARGDGGDEKSLPETTVGSSLPTAIPSFAFPSVPPFDQGGLDDEPAAVFLSRTSGPGGLEVRISGKEFRAGERIVIRFHTEQIADTTADDQGNFQNVVATIPTSFARFAPQQFSIVAEGESSLKSARAPFTISG